jgi:hypothetical protein
MFVISFTKQNALYVNEYVQVYSVDLKQYKCGQIILYQLLLQ